MRRRTALWICSALGCSREAASASKMASLWLVTESPFARQCAAKVSTWERSSVRVGRFSIRRGSSIVALPRSLHHTRVRLANSETNAGVSRSTGRAKSPARPIPCRSARPRKEQGASYRSGEGALPWPARAPERPGLAPGERGASELGQVLVDELRHLEHRDGLLAAEDLAERLVGVDVPLLLLVLQIVLLHVGPDLLHHLRAGDRFFADDLGEGRAWRHRLHERCIRLAGGLLRGGLLGGLFRGHLLVLLLERALLGRNRAAL